jgi:thiol:disulfide interchange protein
MLKNILFIALGFFIQTSIFAQTLNPVKWSFSSEQISDDEFIVTFKASIQDKWYVYSQAEVSDGPVPTSFVFEPNANLVLVGKTTESGKVKKEGIDEMFDVFITKYGKEATFQQKVKIKKDTKLTGYLEYMTCDDIRCLPPEEIDFSIDLKLKANENSEENTGNTSTKIDLSNTTISFGNGVQDVASNTQNTDEEVLQPVKWNVFAEEEGNNLKLTFKAIIQNKWYLYAQDIGDSGPIPTTFIFEPNEYAVLNGFAKEISDFMKEGYDEMFGMNIKKYANEVDFVYVLENYKKEGVLKGSIEYMTCDDERCLPPDFTDFEIDLATLNVTFAGASLIDDYEWGNVPVDMNNPIAQCSDLAQETKDKSNWAIFILGFLGGLVALLTPCVFPMIPLTVSFFTKGSENRKKGLMNAFLYGFFIFMVYVLFSIPFHLIDSLDPDILNQISTSVALNIVFFIIFVVFAFSFFGYYEITLPSGIANKVSAAEGVGGLLGIFFMALTLAIVSFSCTGPILGSLLAGALSSDGGATQLTAGMAGFGLALALPFAVFAAFPGMMNALPKSGGWLNTVKVVLGFLELALAFKFLSNADLVKNWGLLKIEVFLAIWIIIAIATAVYLLGKIKFPHDSPVKKLSFFRISTAILFFAFGIYMLSGFRYNEKTKTFQSLSLLSGLAPPVGYSWIHPNKCPQNFECFKDYYEGLAHAKKVNKPIMLDFTGHACVNCRKVEEHIWPNKEVSILIDKEYVLISLYVDERIDLPDEDQRVVYYNGKERKLKNVGNKWAYFQAKNFKEVSQPQYVLLSTDEQLLTAPIGYSTDLTPEKYAAFLRCGLETFRAIE